VGSELVQSRFSSLAELALGAVLFQLASVFDGVDGEIARAAQRSSKAGASLDSLIDAVTSCAFLAGAVASFRMPGDETTAIMCIAALPMQVTGLTILRQSAWRSDMVVQFDSARAAIASAPRGAGRVIKDLTSRNFYCFAFMLATFGGVLAGAVTVFAAGSAVWLVFVIRLELRDFGEHPLGPFGAADEQVGHEGIGLVVDERAAVDARTMQAVCERHGDGRAAVPFVLTAGVEIDLGFAPDHGHRLGAGATHRHKLSAERLGDGLGLGRGASAADEEARTLCHGKQGLRLVGPQHDAAMEAWQGHCAKHRRAIQRQRYVHRPIGATFAVFAGAIDRIDDPHPALRAAPGIVLFLFGKQAIMGSRGADRIAQQAVGGSIARIAQRLAGQARSCAHLKRQLPGFFGKIGREFGIGHNGKVHLSGNICWMM
jgi:phosphatidylglycerophosphate synthase